MGGVEELRIKPSQLSTKLKLKLKLKLSLAITEHTKILIVAHRLCLPIAFCGHKIYLNPNFFGT